LGNPFDSFRYVAGVRNGEGCKSKVLGSEFPSVLEVFEASGHVLGQLGAATLATVGTEPMGASMATDAHGMTAGEHNFYAAMGEAPTVPQAVHGLPSGFVR
jgi:hypothetical protein